MVEIISQGQGCEVAPLEFDALPDTPLDAAIVTTCGFIGEAKKQSVQTIVDLADAKQASARGAEGTCNGLPRVFPFLVRRLRRQP